MGFRQADDCPYFNSCFDKPYGGGKWNGNLSNTSILNPDNTMSEDFGSMTITEESSIFSVSSDSSALMTGSFTTLMGNTQVGKQNNLSIFVNFHSPHRPSKPEYPEPIPLPLSVTLLLWGLFIIGVIKMFKHMDDLENIR